MSNSSISAYIKPSDAKPWSLCKRRAWLENQPDSDIAPIEDPFEQLVIELGLQHEQNVLESISRTKEVETAKSEKHTQELIQNNAEVIYQPQLLDKENGFIGTPDFLIKHDSGRYQPADAKLSLSETKKEIQVQLGLYRKMLNTDLPAIVFLGDGTEALIGDEVNSVTEKFVIEMRELLSINTEPEARYSHSKCKACPFYLHCKPKFEQKEELSLLYGVQGRAAAGLEKVRIETITQLANNSSDNIPDVPYLKGEEKKQRAVLQAKSHLTSKVFQHNPVSLPEGDWIHFDIEDNPLTESGNKHVYLWGFLPPNYDNDNFEYVWTDNSDKDEQGWINFLNKIEEYRNEYSSLILAHYSNYEYTTIKSYAKRYDMEDHETVMYLLGDDSPLFDLQKPILDSLVLPLQGYGLKNICKHKDLVNFQWEDDSSGSQWSVVQFNRFLSETSQDEKERFKNEILGYNRDDVIATRRLEEWLRKNFS